MKLYAYQLNSQIIGIDLTSWNDEELIGNPAFIILEDDAATPNDYLNISSIVNWYNFSPDVKIARQEIYKLATSLGYVNLSEAEKTAYDATNPYLLIQDYVDESIKIESLDYDILGFFKKQTFVKGDLILVEYFSNYDEENNVYSGLLIKEERIYYRVDTRLRKREMTITWYLSDGTAGIIKNTVKFYSVLDSGQYGIDRRRNIVEEIKIIVVYLLMMTEQLDRQAAEDLGTPMLAAIDDYIHYYINNAVTAVIDVINADTNFSFLDNAIGANGTSGGVYTIRNYIADALYIDYDKLYTLADKSPYSL